jgi:hypothetical protein
MKNLALILATGSVAMTALPAQAFTPAAVPAPVAAAHTLSAPGAAIAHHHERTDRRYGDYGYDDRRWDDRRWDDRRWDDRRGDYWQGNDGRWRCRRADGTTGLLVGAVGGALLGRTIDRRGDRSLGTILGAIGGGLLGREVDRGGSRCR